MCENPIAGSRVARGVSRRSTARAGTGPAPDGLAPPSYGMPKPPRRHGLETRAILGEVGRCRLVKGQEDKITDIPPDLAAVGVVG
ncbi:hypothetical protein [Streptomyces sp. 351MFTsu5.1]|uniref:hypothetical protein n=1 Tax=Streptomyces sp. 351MFTsu5.1 TaxID=1172180 RepID=UPI003B632A4D